ncbi:uncharacterized protein LOC115438996 [Sphaeramia orbicularis]|uniref:uncharacterized protein LOC115438996 n=1 Tax=Sphaeramia orbicularis TaxID=375764 RepID=UPI00117FC8B8|nr:uncharacterized protein LOC115438996 [Sphaeramia orbicularis]
MEILHCCAQTTPVLLLRVVKRSEPNKIASIFDPSKVDSFQNGKFEVTSNISHIFLKIKQVNVSDSGLYFCGFLMQQKTVIVHPTYLDVKGVFDIVPVLNVILDGLTVFFFMVIIVLVLKMYKSHKGHHEEHVQQSIEVNNVSFLHLLSSTCEKLSSITPTLFFVSDLPGSAFSSVSLVLDLPFVPDHVSLPAVWFRPVSASDPVFCLSPSGLYGLPGYWTICLSPTPPFALPLSDY